MKLDNRTIARLPLPEDRHKADAIYFDETVSGSASVAAVATSALRGFVSIARTAAHAA